MIKQIQNEYLKAEVSLKGAEIISIKDHQGNDILWTGDPNTWTDHAPVLFPYIARLTNGTYTYQGEEYHMQIHGLAMYSDFQVKEESNTKLVLYFTDSEETRKQYPFSFCFEVGYELVEKKLLVTYHVKNTGANTMHFAVGGHPGFCVPFTENETFEDYQISFETGKTPVLVEMSDDCFVVELPYEERKKLANPLPLTHRLFDNDALVLEDMGAVAKLESKKSGRSITVSFPGIKYLGIWHWPRTDVPYVCIEPWTALPSRKGIVEAIEEQKDLFALEPEKEYEVVWTMEFDR